MMRQFVFVFVLATVGLADVGRLDTIGGTTYDWQMNGGAVRRLVNSPMYGLHATWVYSADTTGTFPDRNLGYNFYDFTTRTWNWFDPDFMQSGIRAYTSRCGSGNLDACRATGRVEVCSYYGSPPGPVLARDAAAGAGIFEYSVGPPGYLWPVLAVGQESTAHVAMFDDSSRAGAWYSRVRSWPTWDPPEELARPGTYEVELASARTGLGVCVAWTCAGGNHYMVSDDGGDNWSGVDSLPVPPAFSGDTVPVFSDYGLFPFYDAQTRLHFAATIIPVVHDTMYNMPAEIWHWCAQNSPNWARVHRAGCLPENMQGSIGYNAAYACRPSLGEDEHGILCVAWEQFDSSNVEPLTGLLRAGIWAVGSENNGVTWPEARMITERGNVSNRFPCIADMNLPSTMETDTVFVVYEIDQVAGFAFYGQGPYTYNPVVCQTEVVRFYGVSERGANNGLRQATRIGPTVLSGASSVKRLASSVIFDAMGRKVVNPKSGVYFVTEKGARPVVRARKVILTR